MLTHIPDDEPAVEQRLAIALHRYHGWGLLPPRGELVHLVKGLPAKHEWWTCKLTVEPVR